MSDLPSTVPLAPFVVVAGLCIGSFLNVCIHRIPLKLSVVTPRSRCPQCSTVLAWYDNVPLVSYAVLRGRCRGCRTPISLRYPIVEAITGLIWLLNWWAFGPTPLLVVRLVFSSALIVLFAIDLDHQILPDVITKPGIVAGFVGSLLLPPGPLMSAAGLLFGGGILWGIAEAWYRIKHVEGMGFGDVKMLAMVGAFLGFKLVVLTFVLAALLGGLVGVVLLASRRADLATRVPFGTMLALAALVASLYGDGLASWYLGSLHG